MSERQAASSRGFLEDYWPCDVSCKTSRYSSKFRKHSALTRSLTFHQLFWQGLLIGPALWSEETEIRRRCLAAALRAVEQTNVTLDCNTGRLKHRAAQLDQVLDLWFQPRSPIRQSLWMLTWSPYYGFGFLQVIKLFNEQYFFMFEELSLDLMTFTLVLWGKKWYSTFQNIIKKCFTE